MALRPTIGTRPVGPASPEALRPGRPPEAAPRSFAEALASALARTGSDLRASPEATVELVGLERLRSALSTEPGAAEHLGQNPVLEILLSALARGEGGATTAPHASAASASPGDGSGPYLDEAARREGLDPTLVRAVVQAESGFDPGAVSRAGALGLMQLMPATAAELGVDNPLDPVQNVAGGTRYLKSLLERYAGDLDLALAAYNWGPANVDRSPGDLPAETRAYVARVKSLAGLGPG